MDWCQNLITVFDVVDLRFPINSGQKKIKTNIWTLCGSKLGPGFKVILDCVTIDDQLGK